MTKPSRKRNDAATPRDWVALRAVLVSAGISSSNAALVCRSLDAGPPVGASSDDLAGALLAWRNKAYDQAWREAEAAADRCLVCPFVMRKEAPQKD